MYNIKLFPIIFILFLQENYQHINKSSARERRTICRICFKDVVTHFTRHLFRHHENNKEVILIKSLKPRSKKRLALLASLRKRGYFLLKNEKGVLNPVRSSKNTAVDYFVCTYCLGYYSKKLLYKHVKTCKQRPANILCKAWKELSFQISKFHSLINI